MNKGGTKSENKGLERMKSKDTDLKTLVCAQIQYIRNEASIFFYLNRPWRFHPAPIEGDREIVLDLRRSRRRRRGRVVSVQGTVIRFISWTVPYCMLIQ